VAQPGSEESQERGGRAVLWAHRVSADRLAGAACPAKTGLQAQKVNLEIEAR